MADSSDTETLPSLLYISRGEKGLRWVYSDTQERWRVVDTYAENLPEALIEWCEENDHRLTVLYESPPPVMNGETPYAHYGARVREVVANELVKGLPPRRDATQAFTAVYDERLQDADFQDVFSYEGVPLFHALDKTPRQFPLFASAHAHGVRRWTQILETLKPRALFAGRLDVRPDICLACSRLGIRSVGVKLGIGEEMLAPFAWSGPDGQFAADTFPDVLALWGEAQRRLIERRFPDAAARLIVSGRTRNDTFVEAPSRGAVQAVRERLELGDRHVILYGANQATKFGMVGSRNFGSACMSPHAYEGVLRDLVAYARESDGYVIVKPHPSDDIDAIRAIVEGLEPAYAGLLTDKDGFHNAEILAVSDAFVSSVSSMFSEAVLAGVPAVNIWVPDVNFLYEGGRLDAFAPISITAESGAETVNVLNRLRNEPAYWEAEMARMTAGLETIFGPTDGQNARRLVGEAMVGIDGDK